jgi:hypothetical protein
MQPTVRRLEETHGGRIIFTGLDIDDPLNADFKAQLQFRAQPQWVLLDGDGQVLKTWFGRVSEQEFATAFDEALR